MTTRSFRVADNIWLPALERARAEGTTLTAVLTGALTAYTADEGNPQPPAEAARRPGWCLACGGDRDGSHPTLCRDCRRYV